MTKKEMLNEMFLNTPFSEQIEKMVKMPKGYIEKVYAEWKKNPAQLNFYRSLLTK